MSFRVSLEFHVGFLVRMSKQSCGFLKGFFKASFRISLGFLQGFIQGFT